MLARNGRWLLAGFALVVLYLFYGIDHSSSQTAPGDGDKLKGSTQGSSSSRVVDLPIFDFLS
jgi:hypothetical protein